jgi:UDP-N-acetylmuramoyl-L-alanyl-D-glutamate--2,6-diaminopimelate ligase
VTLVGASLGQICAALGEFDPVLAGDPELRVVDVDQDSRSVGPGSLFVARPGGSIDGARFATDAVRRGALAVMAGTGAVLPELRCPVLRVRNVERALGFAAEVVHHSPSRELALVGITGTNGKTTVCWLVQRILEELGVRCGRIGTLGWEVAGHLDDTQLTTPEADDLSRCLSQMRSAGASHAVMEVSSNALSSARVDALDFDVAALSNLTRDHLDFHGTFEAYGAAKARLFSDLRPRTAVINVDDAFGRALQCHADCRRISVGQADDCTVSLGGLTAGPSGVTGTVVAEGVALKIETRLIGQHNAENIGLALGVLLALGQDLPRAAAAARQVDSAPGRLERCDGSGDDCTVVVDYAHTPDALKRVLTALRGVTNARLICVFGCGGDRDPGKRFPMGKAVGEGADFAIVTNDNPRSESPEAIAEAVEAGLRASGGRYTVCLDREQAIEQAIVQAQRGDLVLVAGKGHETYQDSADGRRDFDDREQARRALAKRRRASGGSR